ncbi:sphingosine kinase 1-like isoform X2 [Oculina patagonica]
MTDTEADILGGQFELVPTKKIFFVSLSRKSLTYSKSAEGCCPCVGKHRSATTATTNLSDIYGAKAYRGPDDDPAAYFQVYSCPVSEKKRARQKICFKVASADCQESNVAIAEQWVRTILWLIKEPEKNLNDVQEGTLPSSRKLLILINPFSGSGKSLKIFYDKVEPMLNEAEIEFNAVTTEYAGHAVEIMLSMNLLHVDGIVICSGDGLVYEVINGLMKRPDWEAAINIPLGVIPTGSGNALCLSALHATGEPFDLTSAIFGVIRGNLLDLDICSVVTPTEKLYAFLSVTWGMVSDVDIESEKYRCLGETRFLVGTIARIIGLRKYRGRLSYLPAENTPGGENNLAFDSSPGELRDGMVKDNASTTLNHRENCQGNKTVKDLVHKDSNEGLLCHGPSNNLLPPLSSELPPSWKVEEGEFILGCPVFLSHLGTDLMANPEGKFGDGLMGIFYVKSGTGRMALLDLFGKMKDGSHVLSHHVKYIRAFAFRLEPDTSQPGTIAVDGEKIDYVPIQGQIHRSLGKLMCVTPPKVSE